ncbi:MULTISPECIES: TlpA family protein disulfide reductase [Flavobacteriaceae]|uniref:TlpA family protein disulfide reductase n=1 Tax=Flavobacteriaceae TaxID=49546 RepID=UPI00149280EE|nr:MULTISPECIES: transaldolase [Allomuricauda]MDC6364921.1 transaldolase [Muricauda sp. AC10]
MVRFLLGLSFLAVLACSQKHGECPSVFFGGEIVNPTSDYVVLYRNDTYIDSVKLDDNNRFAFNLQGIDEGLYHFDHSPELQYVYLQEGDSLLIRLNTVEFDESLVFSGNGSEINNFLVEMYLAHEKEEPIMYDYYALSPEKFKHKADSLQSIKLKHLEELTNDNQLGDKVLTMAKASVDYNNFIYREKYPFYHKKKTGEETIHNLTEDFYDYRKNIDLNSQHLTFFRPYFDYMKYHFGNLSYMACLDDCNSGKIPATSHLHFNKHKLHLVDSLVQQESLRNLLFRNIAMDYLLKEHKSNKECQIFIDKFRKLSTNEDHKNEISHLYEGIQNLQPGMALPDLKVKDFENKEHSLKEISQKRNTVFYFWTTSQKKHFSNVTELIEKLERNYPDYTFVGINLRTSPTQWAKIIEEKQLDKNNQFYGEDFKEIQTTMIIDGLNKCVIAKDTVIVDAFANLYYSFKK